MSIFAFVAALAALQLPPTAASEAPPRPNVLLITMDQLSYSWIGALGSGFPKVDTPALDQLIAAGVTYHRHYTENEVCHPSRCTILTGRPPDCHRALDNNVTLPESEETWAEMLQAMGWRTGAFGKIHSFSEGAWQGFDVAVDKEQIDAWLATQGIFLENHVVWFDFGHRTGKLIVQARYQPETIVANLAMDFMQQSGSQSWFAYVSFNNPHPPSVATSEAWTGVNPLDVPNMTPEHSFFIGKPAFTLNRALSLSFPDLDRDKARLHYAGYVAMIEETDRQIGRVLNWVDQNVHDRPTIVVFTSDHGDMAGQLGLFDKLFGPYESAVHVPAVIVMEGVLPAGGRVNEFSQHGDLLPTVLELLGVRIPSKVKGKSLIGLAFGGPPVHNYVFSGRELGNVSRMISDGLYSLITHPGLPSELYDLQLDPQQTENLIDDPLYFPIRDRLVQELNLWRANACQ
ncbi:MAG: sulfatase-like hydrolase/transferase [Planctomycetota bacterium]|nr:sulfatase-like hydrolase/transferase [Planctomycetota bacterium]